MNEKTFKANLAYSGFHRAIGYSYFAMDLDFIEIRNGSPKAVVETSICTKNRPNCDGKNGVIDRFLQETGGFQFEVTYWVANWLGVKAYVVCFDPADTEKPFFVLNLSNSETREFSKEEYKDFLFRLPEEGKYFSQKSIKLPQILETLVSRYPGLRAYPYFKNPRRWEECYNQRLAEISENAPRIRPDEVPTTKKLAVKSETTGERPSDYLDFRNTLQEIDWININWLEWRKDSGRDLIGRPAAIIQTIPQIHEDFKNYTNDEIGKVFDEYISSKYGGICNQIALSMNLTWYLVIFDYDPLSNQIITFHVRRNDGRTRVFSPIEFVRFLKTL